MNRKVFLRGSAILMLFFLCTTLVHADDAADEATTDKPSCVGDDCGTTEQVKIEGTAATTDANSAKADTTMVTKNKDVTTKQTPKETAVTAKVTKKPCKKKPKKESSEDSFENNEEEIAQSDETTEAPTVESINIYIVNRRRLFRRRKPIYIRVPFPVHHIQDYHQFPTKRFPTLVSASPWLPIHYDQKTLQTFIYSKTGGFYILPPVMNFYGQKFAVAQLIKWGYASLNITGTPPSPNVDISPLVQQQPVANVFGTASAQVPVFDSSKTQFNGGVQASFLDTNGGQ